MSKMTAKNPPKQPREPGVPNKLNPSLAAALADESTGAQWGPCMKALSDRQKAFVLALYQLPPGYGVNVRAAKMAGYGTDRTTWKCWSVIGSRVAHDEKVLAAIHEEDKKRIRASAPRAIRALSNMVEDPDHRDHIRAVTAVLDRVHPAETHHTVAVHHTIDHNDEAIESLRAFKRLGVAHEKLLELYGYSGLSRYEAMLAERDGAQKRVAGPGPKPAPPVIEAEVVEVKPAAGLDRSAQARDRW